jgi:hypothetical protein
VNERKREGGKERLDCVCVRERQSVYEQYSMTTAQEKPF